ncbi:tetratricopeptide repeat protein [Aurantiacibacter poecillastricola]|uniref:tetratricopeptide repeat protein n=1 Tax=Aurantiacibacter poecillastricola TaxID=3064385 RepID=UPI00273F07FD|nr:tetratricopeptide repeat protein [Aurantiacibacter sp. 219JJ12-13]MDP5261846.1 tetratricopeptide repeat protein [Aurantiacibacter sp. 219JJ12-13]
MRFAPVAAALSLALALQASIGNANDYEVDPRAQALVAEGRTALNMGETQEAIDAFEAALAVDPGYTAVYLELANAARAESLQGKAIHYYREAQERDPENLAAITGEGEALVEKGALSAARENLTRLQDLCGETCIEAVQLAAAIDRGPPVMTAEVISPEEDVAKN